MKYATLPLLCLCPLLGGCSSGKPFDDRYTICFVVIGLVFAIFLVLAHYSNILRDEVSDCDAFNEEAKKLPPRQRMMLHKRDPYSLTKVQFGLWTVIIASAYIYLSLFKGDCADMSINKTALVLMGIFAGTTAASTIIDKREISDNRPRHQNTPSQGLFIDILSDDNGISLHRFQNLIWTLIAIAVYLYKLSQVKTGCMLPELSDTLLALTGLSSATFLVMRTQENAPPIAEAVKEAAAAAAVDAHPPSPAPDQPASPPSSSATF